jgi:mRNA interferase RelE/StbE
VPIRVELTSEALDDLERYVRSGNLERFLAKLVRLEADGPQVGQPLRGELHGFRKIVVGDRDWRIIFRTDAAETVATVWVIGDRAARGSRRSPA